MKILAQTVLSIMSLCVMTVSMANDLLMVRSQQSLDRKSVV